MDAEIFFIRLGEYKSGQPPLALTVINCRKCWPILALKFGSLIIKTHFISLWGVSKIHFSCPSHLCFTAIWPFCDRAALSLTISKYSPYSFDSLCIWNTIISWPTWLKSLWLTMCNCHGRGCKFNDACVISAAGLETTTQARATPAACSSPPLSQSTTTPSGVFPQTTPSRSRSSHRLEVAV